MTTSAKFRASLLLAIGAGLALRLYLIHAFPTNAAGDSEIYLELAHNWLDHGVYGMSVYGRLTPVDLRPPGYPAFLAAVYATLGRSRYAVLLAQGFLDLTTCVLVALLAARMAPAEQRRRAWLAGLWLAALCPFVANYSTGILTEVLATFLTALALVVLAGGLVGDDAAGWRLGRAPDSEIPRWRLTALLQSAWFLGGLVVGFGALVRPEAPLLLLAAGLVLLVRWRRRADWLKLIRAAALMFVGMILPLLPWAARNWRVLGDVQFLAPRYSQLPGELVPRGFYAWTNTWMWRFRDVYLVPWKLEDEEIHVEDLPGYAFDSEEERERIAGVLDEYNDSLTLSAEEDRAFGEIARERTARHPLRTYFSVPLKRAFVIWFTPRIELLPFSGQLWPIRAAWEEDPVDFSVTIGLATLAIILAGAGIWGAWLARGSPVAALLVVFCLVRTLFFLHVETPEPRYVIECFPAVLALAAQIFVRRRSGTFSPHLR
jgi:hypothetical protein